MRLAFKLGRVGYQSLRRHLRVVLRAFNDCAPRESRLSP